MAKKIIKKNDSYINDLPFKMITEIDPNTDRVISVMVKPKLKQIDQTLHISGCHIFQDNPKQNHYDHYENGRKWEERSNKDKKLKFPYILEEDKVIILGKPPMKLMEL